MKAFPRSIQGVIPHGFVSPLPMAPSTATLWPGLLLKEALKSQQQHIYYHAYVFSGNWAGDERPQGSTRGPWGSNYMARVRHANQHYHPQLLQEWGIFSREAQLYTVLTQFLQRHSQDSTRFLPGWLALGRNSFLEWVARYFTQRIPRAITEDAKEAEFYSWYKYIL